ncbi:two-component response regulator [Chondrocystis sp. NIES-4102]|nr:two-component response regulator [Chondrocystis sp. NIES-4102]
MPLLILIAEDDVGIRLAVSDYLELLGYSVIAAANGKEALAMLDKYHPHLLISDIKMPEKDGYELLKNIRQLPQYRLLPVILLSECKKTNERIRGYQVGCDIYLPKPFEMEELGAVIRNLLERSQVVHSELLFSQSNKNDDSPDILPPAESKLNQQPIAKLELTSREKEVLKLLMDGCSNIEIGQKLHLSPRTIEKYVSSLLRKTDKSKRSELIRFALEYHTM